MPISVLYQENSLVTGCIDAYNSHKHLSLAFSSKELGKRLLIGNFMNMPIYSCLCYKFPIKMGIYAQTPVFQVYMSSTELIFLEKYSKYFSKHFLLENGCLITKTPRHQRANSTCSFSLLIRAHKSSLMLPQVALAKLKLGLKEAVLRRVWNYFSTQFSEK